MPTIGVLITVFVLWLCFHIDSRRRFFPFTLTKTGKVIGVASICLALLPVNLIQAATLLPNFENGRPMNSSPYIDSLGNAFTILTGENPIPVYANTWSIEPAPGNGQIIAQKYSDGGIERWHNSAMPDFVSKQNDSSTSSMSLPQNIRGDDTIIAVGISYRTENNESIDSISFLDADSQTNSGTHVCTSTQGNLRSEIWYTDAPNVGAGTVQLDWTDTVEDAYVQTISFLNVDKSGGPIRASNCDSSVNDTTQDLLISGISPKDRLFGVITGDGSSSNAITPYSNDVNYWDGNLGKIGASDFWNESQGDIISGGSITTVYESFSADFTLRWEQTETNPWAAAGVAIKGLDVENTFPEATIYSPNGNYHNIRSFAAASDGQYGYVMAWTVYDSGFDTDYDVYVQKVDRFGIPLYHQDNSFGERPFVVATDVLGNPDNLAVKADNNGDPVVVYAADEIKSAKVSKHHSQWVDTEVMIYGGFDSGFEHLTMTAVDSSQNFIVTAFDSNFDGSNQNRMFTQKISASDGSLQWNSGNPLSVAPNTNIADEELIVSPSNDGGAAYVLNTNSDEVKLKYIAADGTSMWGTDGTLVSSNGYAPADRHRPELTLQARDDHWFLAYKEGYSDFYRLHIQHGDPNYTVISNELIETDVGLAALMTDGAYNSVAVYHKNDQVYATSVDGIGDLRIPEDKVVFNLPVSSTSINMLDAVSNREYYMVLKVNDNTDWDFYFQRFVHVHNVIGLDSNMGAFTEWGNEVSLNGEQGWIESYLPIRLKDKAENAFIAQVPINLEDDRNWSGVSGEVSLGQFKSVVAGLGSAPGVLSTHSLFVPYTSAHNFVHICPTATTLVQVTAECAGGYNLRESDPQVEIVNIDGIDYWRIDGLTGTGGIGVSLQDGIQFNLIPNFSATNATQEVIAEYAPIAEFNPGDQIAIDFDTGGSFTLDNTCAAPTTDADADGTPDGSATVVTNGGSNIDRYLYTFTSATTQTIANGISLCINVTSPGVAANYRVDLADQLGNYGSTFYYVGSENMLNVIGYVDPVLTMVVRTADDTTDQGNISGSTGPNLCNLGNLSDAGVQSCSYRLKVTTNAANGYAINVQTDGDLRKNLDAIDNVIEDSTNVSAAVEGYGIQVNPGQITSGSISAVAPFDDDDSPIGTGTNTTLVSATGPNNPQTVDTDNTTLITHVAEASSSTPAGTYTQLVTYTVSASF
jgi:hypothetical protein